MKTRIHLITVLISVCLVGCSTQSFGPGPKGPIGPQGDLGPQDSPGPSVSDAITIANNGSLVFEEYDFVGFDEIEISSLMDVEISQGETYQITTTVVEDAVPYLQVSLEGKRLRIGLDPSQAYNINQATLHASITLPHLLTLTVSKISHVTLDDFQCAKSMGIVVSEVSSLDGQINGCDLDIQILNTSELTLTGSANHVMVSLALVSKADLSSLEVQHLDFESDLTSQLIQKED